MTAAHVDVLVVGAGPTELTLACQLARFGVRFPSTGPHGDGCCSKPNRDRSVAVSPGYFETMGIRLLARNAKWLKQIAENGSRASEPENLPCQWGESLECLSLHARPEVRGSGSVARNERALQRASRLIGSVRRVTMPCRTAEDKK